MVKRILSLSGILGHKHSAFLFGARGSGKTSLAKQFLEGHGHSREIDLLDPDNFSRYLVQPALFGREIERELESSSQHLTVFVDEVQKLPELLNVVHRLYEKYKGRLQFLLTGSSARKLKRGAANLLGGRAWTLKLHPLTHREGVDDLARALQFGTLPDIYLSQDHPERALRSYVDTYLKEEIMQEALVRQVAGFVRFLDVAAQTNGEPVNHAKLARQCGVSLQTTQSFFSILVDTLIAFRLDGWSQSVRKQLLQSPKYYFFDCGVLNAARGELGTELKPSSYRYGKLFETWIILEVIRLNDYFEADLRMHYWRTNTGMEVDLLLSRGGAAPHWAIEIKSDTAPGKEELTGLEAFRSEHPVTRRICLCRTPRAYRVQGIDVMPWQAGLKEILVNNMNSALIGYTGFVGSNLLKQRGGFDDLYNSKNIETIRGHSYDLLVCAGAPAEKWKANQAPENDRAILKRLMETLSDVKAKSVVLISTVDVYPVPVGVNEDTVPDWTQASAYGRHRHELEDFIAQRFSSLIFRLPGLFGTGLKKNVIYDFLHGNLVDKIHADAHFQFYGLDHLWKDVQTAQRAGLRLVNVGTEPVSVAEVAKEAFGLEFKNRPAGVTPSSYAMQSKHAALFGGAQGYLQSKTQVLSELSQFVKKERNV